MNNQHQYPVQSNEQKLKNDSIIPTQSNLSLLEDAELALKSLSHHEVKLIKETQELFKQQVEFIIKIDELRKHVPNMGRICSEAQKLSSLVDSSHTLVDEVCSKFRRIDLAKGRLEDSLSKIGDILDLKTCREGMVNAMQDNKFEEAAIHIKRFLSIDQQELHKTIAIICDDQKIQTQKRAVSSASLFGSKHLASQGEALEQQERMQGDSISIDPDQIHSSLKELAQGRARLLEICQKNMSEAIKGGNTKEIEQYFKIFPMLNEHYDGLQRYSACLRSKVMTPQLEITLSSKETSVPDKLAALFENVAKLVDGHQPMIETYYGPGHLIIVARVLQKECDILSRRLLEEFKDETDLQQVAKIVRSSSHLPIINNVTQPASNNPQSLNNLSLNSRLDPRKVDKIIGDISMVISRSEVYLNFITKRIQDDIESQMEDEARKISARVELYNMINLECELNHLIQEVGGIYVMLEQYYLNESSKKAIIMDQTDVDPSFTSCLISSMLDDIFFIIKKCTKRAVSTKSNEVFCAIINHCVTLLESAFCQMLGNRLKSQQYFASFSAKNLDFSQAYNAIQSGRYLQSVSDQRKSNTQYFAALNNLDKACEYIRTLRPMLESDVRKLKPSRLVSEKQYEHQVEKSITCLNELSQLVGKFTSIINSTLYQLFNASLRSRIKAELETVLEENPDLITMIKTTSPNELTSLSRNLLKTSDPTLEDSFLPENYARLVSITKDYVSSVL